jgi:nucleoside 2-deoxyribosyltransferase
MKTQIFLSGGTRGTWQDRVKELLIGEEFFDPRTLRAESMRVIADIERDWLNRCDMLFFYLEADNPSGLGSAFEVGYCVANGIPVIFVDEKQTQHTEWIGMHCDQVFYDLNSGIRALEEFCKNNRRTK